MRHVRWTCSVCGWAGSVPTFVRYPGPEFCGCHGANPLELVGEKLKLLLSRFGIQPDDCECDKYAAKLDRWGADECERRADEIVAWLVQQAKKRRLPLSSTPVADAVARRLLARAIRQAR